MQCVGSLTRSDRSGQIHGERRQNTGRAVGHRGPLAKGCSFFLSEECFEVDVVMVACTWEYTKTIHWVNGRYTNHISVKLF